MQLHNRQAQRRSEWRALHHAAPQLDLQTILLLAGRLHDNLLQCCLRLRARVRVKLTGASACRRRCCLRFAFPASQIPPRKIEKPLQTNNMRDLVDKWDANFIEFGEGPSGAAGVAASPAAALSQPTGSPSSASSAASLAAAAASAPSAAAQEFLFKLLLAANYLNIRPLLGLCCAKVASLMKGRTPDQIRAVFNIRNDYTQAEEEEVRKEYKDLIG